jgi:hypothetical protein
LRLNKLILGFSFLVGFSVRIWGLVAEKPLLQFTAKWFGFPHLKYAFSLILRYRSASESLG